MKTGWAVKTADAAVAEKIAVTFGLNPHLAAMLVSRGVTTLNDADTFLSPRLSSVHSPFLMKGMYDAVERIYLARSRDEKIGLFADSDLDGLTSMTVMTRLFEKIGITEKPYNRFPVDDEDYGLSAAVIDEFHRNGVTLMITLDSGIRDVNEIAYARSLGMDVIVCDHHEEGDAVPDAIIVNPKQKGCPYPFKELAGVGVAFKLCHGVLMRSLQRHGRRFVLLAGDDGAVAVAFIRDRIVERIERLGGADAPSALAARVDDGDTIVTFDVDGCVPLKGAVQNHRSHDLCALMNESLRSGGVSAAPMDIDALCAYYSVNRKVYSDKIDCAIELFLENDFHQSPKLKEYIGSIIDLVALGTIADIMPMRGENRILVHHGLKFLNATAHPGLRRLLDSGSGAVTSKYIAWNVTPLLNTPGRFGKTMLTADFFLEENRDRLDRIINGIQQMNVERKAMLSKLYDFLNEGVVSGKYLSGERLFFIAEPDIPEGLCGLLANRLSESFNAPVIVISNTAGKEVLKGSGRSKGGFNFFSCVKPFSGLFEKIGGHPQAFGFSVKSDLVNEVRTSIAGAVDAAMGYCHDPDLLIDAELSIELIDASFVHGFLALEPTGHRNEEAVFLSRNLTIRECVRFGAEKNHGKYFFSENRAVEAIGWNMGRLMEEKAACGGSVDLVYRLENSEFNGLTSCRMVLIDID